MSPFLQALDSYRPITSGPEVLSVIRLTLYSSGSVWMSSKTYAFVFFNDENEYSNPYVVYMDATDHHISLHSILGARGLVLHRALGPGLRRRYLSRIASCITIFESEQAKGWVRWSRRNLMDLDVEVISRCLRTSSDQSNKNRCH